MHSAGMILYDELSLGKTFMLGRFGLLLLVLRYMVKLLLFYSLLWGLELGFKRV